MSRHRDFIGFTVVLAGLATSGVAETVISKRTLQANTVLTASDLIVGEDDSDLTLAAAIGMETRKVIFKGQSISTSDLAPPALVERNQVVLIVFNQRGLSIETEGRALDRGRVGDVIRVMNLGSRSTVSGRVDALGAIQVGK